MTYFPYFFLLFHKTNEWAWPDTFHYIFQRNSNQIKYCYILLHKRISMKNKEELSQTDNQKKCNHIFLHRKEFCKSCLLRGSISRCSLKHMGTCKQISTRAPFYSSLFCWAWQPRCFLSELFWHQESNCCDLDTWMCDSSMAAILFKQLQSWRE